MEKINTLIYHWLVPAMFVITLYGFFMGWFE